MASQSNEMGFKGNIEIPSDEELTIQELDLNWPVLQGAAFYMGKACEWHNNEYILCREETRDPRQCLQEGKNVTACAFEFFKKLKKHCEAEFNPYVDCLERSSGTLEFGQCRNTQAVLDKCVLKNLNIERPPFGYFCEAKIHDSPRPKPKPYVREEYPDRYHELPPRDRKYPDAPYGGRWVWET